MIIDFNENTFIKEQLLVVSCVKGINASGTPYLNIDFRDASGTINGKKWTIESSDEAIYVAGNVLDIEAEVLLYRDTKQLKIKDGKLVPSEKVDVSKFLQKPPLEKDKLIEKFNYYVESIKDETCSCILKELIAKHKDVLFDYPAAISIHHEYSSGLLMHTVTMCDIAEHIITLYKGINRDLLISGILIHDIGKTIEFEGSPAFRYSLEGKLLGHISILISEIKEIANKYNIENETPILLEHMVLSHHGEPEYGSPIRPLIIEALLLNLIDNLDSKMVYALKNLENIEEGKFTARLFALNDRLMYKHK